MIEWYYRDQHNHEVGPLTIAEFEVCVVVGEIRAETKVWHSGLVTWTTYADLLALEDEPDACLSSRQSARAPHSSSYRTLIAMGMSPVHRRPARSRVTTSGCTPFGVAEPGWEEAAAECERDESAELILGRPGADAVWVGRQFVRIALAGAAFLLMHFLWADRIGSPVAHPPATKVEPPVILGPLKPTLSANTVGAFSPAGEMALP